MRLTPKIKGKLHEFFLSELGLVKYNKGWLKGDCPSCGRVGKFGVSLFKNRTNCFVCGYHESPLTVAMNHYNLKTIPETLSRLNIFTGGEYTDPPGEILEERRAELPEGYHLITSGRSFIAKLAREQLSSRGFDILDLATKGVGYCDSGDFSNRIILPFYENGSLVYFNARRILATGSKFKNPNAEEFGLGKSLLIYNVDALKVYRRIYLVESVTNAITIGDNAIAIGGKVLSAYQLMKILYSSCKEVIIILDDDALDYAVKAALSMVNYKKVKVIKMPKDKDVNVLGRNKTMRLVKSSKFLTHRELISMNFELEISWEK